MKIGPIDIGISSLAYLAAVIILSVLALRLWIANSAQRAEGRYSLTIREALNDDKENNLEIVENQCKALLQDLPNNAPAWLHLGVVQYTRQKYSAAEESFGKAGSLTTATPEQRAQGYVGAACAKFIQAAPKDRAQTIPAVQELLKKALEIAPENADALAAMGTVQLWLAKAPQDYDAALDTLKKAEDAKSPPSRVGESRLQAALGVALVSLDKPRPDEAEKHFTRALAGDPGWKDAETYRRLASIAIFAQDAMSIDERRKLIDKYKNDTKLMGEYEPIALNVMGQSLLRMKHEMPERDFLNGPYKGAIEVFTFAIARHAGKPEGYLNLLGLYQQRIFGEPLSPDEHKRQTAALLPRLPAAWLDARLRDLPLTNPWRGGANITLSDTENKVKEEIKSLLTVSGELVRKVQSVAGLLDKDQKRSVAVYNFNSLYLLRALEEDASRRAKLLEDMTNVAAGMGDDPAVNRLNGRLALLRRDYKAAYEAFSKAAQTDNGADLAALIKAFEKTPEIFDPRPHKSVLLGKAPLIGASAFHPGYAGPLTFEIKIDGHLEPVNQTGTQGFLRDPVSYFTDGEHKVEVKVSDALGHAASKDFSFFIDKQPPVLKISPEREAPGPRPVIEVNIEDTGSGVDLESIKVSMTAIGGATPFKDIVLINKGAFTRDLPAVGAKSGDKVEGPKFKLSSHMDLSPGAYVLDFSFADRAGNAGTRKINFEVK